ncbi:uncharacterized protein [Euphorbia lathyris]|uniref:uncharacterized protein n=1 Tax=Euphorbia lathyris TaxID=212925 RepID=UPI003313E9B6
MEKTAEHIKPSEGFQSKNKHISSLGKWIQNFSSELNTRETQLKVALKQIDGLLHLKKEELDSVKKEHEEFSKNLATKKIELSTINKSIEEQNEEFKSNEEKLCLVRMKFEECSNDLSLKTKQLESAKKELEAIEKEVEKARTSVANCNEELEVKHKGLAMIKSLYSDSNSELDLKPKQLETPQELANVHSTELDLKQKQPTEDKHVDSIKVLNDENTEVLEAKGKRSDTNNCSKMLKLKPKHLDSVADEELEPEEEQQDAIKQRIKQLTKKLRSKEEDFSSLKATMRRYCRDLELKVREFNAIRKSIRERNEELAMKEKLLKSIQISCNQLISKEGEFDSMQRKICELRKELEEKEKHFDSMKRTWEERSRKLEIKVKHFEACIINLDQKEQQTLAVYQNRQALEPHDFHHQPNNPWTANPEKTCPWILTDDTGNDSLLPNEVLAALNSSPDPAMFILGLNTNLKTKILLMEKLIEVSPTISPGVKAEAAKLAVSWKANLCSGSDKLTEIWAFLMFLAAYKLVHHFGREEILKLALAVASHRYAPHVCRLLDFTHNIPEIIERLIERKQHIDAARFSTAFGMLHKFPLQFILQKCFEYMKEKAIDEELSVLKAVLQCITDYNLSYRYDTQSIYRRTIELENEKALWSRGAYSLTPASFNTQQNYQDASLFESDRKRARTGTSYLPYYGTSGSVI